MIPFQNCLIDIDIFKNCLIDIDIDIFKNNHIDIVIFQKCRYIDNRYLISIYRTGLSSSNLTVQVPFLQQKMPKKCPSAQSVENPSLWNPASLTKIGDNSGTDANVAQISCHTAVHTEWDNKRYMDWFLGIKFGISTKKPKVKPDVYRSRKLKCTHAHQTKILFPLLTFSFPLHLVSWLGVKFESKSNFLSQIGLNALLCLRWEAGCWHSWHFWREFAHHL